MNRRRSPQPFPQALLLMVGAAMGSVATLSIQYFADDGNPVSGSTVSEPDSGMAPARISALNRRAGDQPLKLNQILTADDPAHKQDDLRLLGRNSAMTNLRDALGMGERIPGEGDRLNFLQGVFDVWGDQAPAEAAKYAQQQFPAGALQSEMIRLAVGGWAAQNPREAFVWVEEFLTGPFKEEAINAMVQSWAGRSPEAAAAWFLETGSTSQPLVTALAGAWAARSPAEAAGWVETALKDPGTRETARVAVAREWARQNPEEAIRHYTPAISEPAPPGANPKRPPGVDLAGVLADIWGTSHPAAAASWVTELPAGPGREEAARTLATVWAASDISGAIQWSNTLSDPGLHAAVIAHLGTTWGAIEPDKTIGWLQTLPPALSNEGFVGAYNSWAGTDPHGLYEWIASEPPGPAMDVARQSLADVWTESDPAAAMDLASGLSSADRQAEAMARYFRKWRQVDEASAGQWLEAEGPGLAAGARQRLSRELGRVIPQ